MKTVKGSNFSQMGGNIATFHGNSPNRKGISSPHFSYNMSEHTETQNLSSIGHAGCKAVFFLEELAQSASFIHYITLQNADLMKACIHKTHDTKSHILLHRHTVIYLSHCISSSSGINDCNLQDYYTNYYL